MYLYLHIPAGEKPEFLVFDLFHEQNELPSVSPAFADFAAISDCICRMLQLFMPDGSGDLAVSARKFALANVGPHGAGGSSLAGAVCERNLELLAGVPKTLDQLAPYIQLKATATLSIGPGLRYDTEDAFLLSNDAQGRCNGTATGYGKGDSGLNTVLFHLLSVLGS